MSGGTLQGTVKTNANKAEKNMLALAKDMVQTTQEDLKRGTKELRDDVRKNAGRPGAIGSPRPSNMKGGPRRVTGRYWRELRYHIGSGGYAQLTTEVGTDEPYAWRLEKGFRGTDSRGRRYNQDPMPHWGPACDKAFEKIHRSYVKSMKNVWKRHKVGRA